MAEILRANNPYWRVPRGYNFMYNVPEAVFPIQRTGEPLGKIHMPLVYTDTGTGGVYQFWSIIRPWEHDVVKKALDGGYDENTYIASGFLYPADDMKMQVDYLFWIDGTKWTMIYLDEFTKRGPLWTSNYSKT